MEILFYKDEEIIQVPYINIIFKHNENEFAKLFVYIPLAIEQLPSTIFIQQLFSGRLVIYKCYNQFNCLIFISDHVSNQTNEEIDKLHKYSRLFCDPVSREMFIIDQIPENIISSLAKKQTNCHVIEDILEFKDRALHEPKQTIIMTYTFKKILKFSENQFIQKNIKQLNQDIINQLLAIIAKYKPVYQFQDLKFSYSNNNPQVEFTIHNQTEILFEVKNTIQIYNTQAKQGILTIAMPEIEIFDHISEAYLRKVTQVKDSNLDIINMLILDTFNDLIIKQHQLFTQNIQLFAKKMIHRVNQHIERTFILPLSLNIQLYDQIKIHNTYYDIINVQHFLGFKAYSKITTIYNPHHINNPINFQEDFQIDNMSITDPIKELSIDDKDKVQFKLQTMKKILNYKYNINIII